MQESEEAVKSARSVGVPTHHYDKDVRDLAALENFWISSDPAGSLIKPL